MIFITLIICVLSFNSVFSQQTARRWADTWEADVKIISSIYSGTGKWKYNFTDKQFYLYKQDGRSDPFCSTIFKKQTNQFACYILVRDHFRYIVFPEKNFCCKCCNAANGCDVLKPEWVTNLTFLEEDTFDGSEAFKYTALPRVYYESKVEGIPLSLTEGSSQLDFTEYKASISNPEVFNLPESCHESCGFNTACTNAFPQN